MGVVEMTIDSLRRNSLSNEGALILKEKGAERYLPIYIGASRAKVIERLLLGTGSLDPAEFDLSSAGINVIFCKVESVIISQFVNNVFRAKLLLTEDDKPCDVDCPPAKAVAHAIRAEASIFAEEAVLDTTGITVPA